MASLAPPAPDLPCAGLPPAGRVGSSFQRTGRIGGRSCRLGAGWAATVIMAPSPSLSCRVEDRYREGRPHRPDDLDGDTFSSGISFGTSSTPTGRSCPSLSSCILWEPAWALANVRHERPQHHSHSRIGKQYQSAQPDYHLHHRPILHERASVVLTEPVRPESPPPG